MKKVKKTVLLLVFILTVVGLNVFYNVKKIMNTKTIVSRTGNFINRV